MAHPHDVDRGCGGERGGDSSGARWQDVAHRLGAPAPVIPRRCIARSGGCSSTRHPDEGVGGRPDRGQAGRVDRGRQGLGDAPVDRDVVEDQPDDAVVGIAGDPGQARRMLPARSTRLGGPGWSSLAGGVGDRRRSSRTAAPARLRWVHDPDDDHACLHHLTALVRSGRGRAVCHPTPGATWPILIRDLLESLASPGTRSPGNAASATVQPWCGAGCAPSAPSTWSCCARTGCTRHCSKRSPSSPARPAAPRLGPAAGGGQLARVTRVPGYHGRGAGPVLHDRRGDRRDAADRLDLLPANGSEGTACCDRPRRDHGRLAM